MFKIPILLLINSKFLLLSLMVFGCLLILLGWDCGQRFRWRPVETHFHRTVTGPKTDSALAQGRATCVLFLSEVTSESIDCWALWHLPFWLASIHRSGQWPPQTRNCGGQLSLSRLA